MSLVADGKCNRFSTLWGNYGVNIPKGTHSHYHNITTFHSSSNTLFLDMEVIILWEGIISPKSKVHFLINEATKHCDAGQSSLKGRPNLFHQNYLIGPLADCYAPLLCGGMTWSLLSSINCRFSNPTGPHFSDYYLIWPSDKLCWNLLPTPSHDSVFFSNLIYMSSDLNVKIFVNLPIWYFSSTWSNHSYHLVGLLSSISYLTNYFGALTSLADCFIKYSDSSIFTGQLSLSIFFLQAIGSRLGLQLVSLNPDYFSLQQVIGWHFTLRLTHWPYIISRWLLCYLYFDFLFPFMDLG